MHKYSFPAEDFPHEGTWLQWPHHYQYGINYRDSLDETWIKIVKALKDNERVHIVVYDKDEEFRVKNLLHKSDLTLTNIGFNIHKTNDVWIRDNGPIFVKNSLDDLVAEHWGFNGWGGKFPYDHCSKIPSCLATDLGMDIVKVNMVVEGGAIEVDGKGVLLATKSSIISQTPRAVRNPGLNKKNAESILAQYYGVSKVIWLEGGYPEADLTDMHIDLLARFAPENRLLTMSHEDLTFVGLSKIDVSTLYTASNTEGVVYSKIILPLTQNLLTATNGARFKGSYTNFYVGNEVVLVPNYNDPNDSSVNSLFQDVYPNRKVIPIDVRILSAYGGAIHCVTQQQPLQANSLSINKKIE